MAARTVRRRSSHRPPLRSSSSTRPATPPTSTPATPSCDTGSTNAAGDPECTLRAAIEEANQSAALDTIEFAIPDNDPNHLYHADNSVPGTLGAPVVTGLANGSITDFDPDYPGAPFSWWNIATSGGLPSVTATVTIDGTTQPGWQANTASGGNQRDVILPIVVTGDALTLLTLDGSGSTVRGVNFSGGNSSATVVVLGGTGGHTFEGSWAQVGPIGITNASLGDDGIYTAPGSDGNQIGGPDPEDHVLIGNGYSNSGLDLSSNGNTVQNLWIGAQVTGDALLPGYNDIPLYVSGSDNTIGTVGAGIVVSSSLNDILILNGDRNTVQASSFGHLPDGTVSDIEWASIGGNDNLVGGVNAGEGNRFGAGDNSNGSAFYLASGTGNSLLGNTYVGAGELVIDLSPPAGVNTNDAGDVDTGTNDLLNHPVITLVTPAGATATVDYELDVPAGDYRIEFYADDTEPRNPDGYGAGEVLVGTQDITHAGSGVETFQASISDLGSYWLAATATENLGGGDYGSTSEFGPTACVGDTDGDGLCDLWEDANLDLDNDPATNPGPDTDVDTNANYNDPDDDGDGNPTASENADPNGDGDPRDALDTDRDGQPDYLDPPTSPTGGVVVDEQKISDTSGGLAATLMDDDQFGHAVAAIGDLDGDGVNDIAVGAPNDDAGGTDRGAVHILFLNADGSVKAEQEISETAGGLATTLGNFDAFGYSVAGLGDIDGDGIGDLLVGAEDDDDGGNARGAVYVLFLNADGTVKAERKISDLTGGLTATLDDYDRFGTSVAGLGDIDGDGINDAAVGAILDDDGGDARGAVHILFLHSDGTVKAEQKISDLVGGLAAAFDDIDMFGSSVAGLGDVDGDGVGDLAVGARDDDDGGSNRGAVHVLFLNSDGTVKAEQKISDTAGGLTTALDNSDNFGFAVGGVGDLDGNGAADVVVGARSDDDGGTGRGAVYVLFLNSDGTVLIEQKISDAVGGLAATLDNLDYLGTSVAGLGDLDGDGTIGLAVGAWGDDDGGGERGAVHVLDLSAFNNAPVLDNTGAMALDPIDKTNFTSAGNTVAEIITSAGGDRITDADGDPEGIMITDATSSDNGWFEFSTDGGTTWTRFGWFWHGLLLRDTDLVRFVPTGFEAETGTLTVRAWDRTSGTAGTTLRTYSTGGTAAFSAVTETVTIATNDVNQLPTFGTSGSAGVAGGSTNLLTWDREGGSDRFESVAEAPDGSFFITSYGPGDTAGNDEVLLVKLTAAGAVDTTFGDGGHVVVPLGADDERGLAVVVQADGKVVVAGQMMNTNWDGFVARFNADGSLDPTFGGGDGWAALDLGGSEYFYGVAVHSDGTITAAGRAGDLLVARYLVDGTLDPSFGTGGSVVHIGYGDASDVALDSTGRPVVPTRDTSGPVDRIGAIRLTTTGVLDTTFDGDGVALTDLGLINATAHGNGVAVLPDDRIVVTGTSWDNASAAWEDNLSRIPIVRFTTTGALDPTFGGGDGYVLAEVPGGAYWGAAEAIAVAPDGDLVTAGHHDVGYKGQNDAVVSRHLADGSLDASFTGDGVDVARTGRYWNYLYDVTVASTGTIVAVGYTSWGDAMVLFYDAAGAPVPAPITNTLDGAPTYLAYGDAVVMDSDVRVFDKELIDRADWSGSSLTIARQGGADVTDVFEATGDLDPLTEAGPLVIDGVTVGTVTTNSAGALQLDFAAGSTEARVSKVLQALAYRNTTANTGTYTMEWTFADGDGGTDTGTIDITVVLTGITVNSTGDGSDATPGDEVCDTGGTNSDGDPECTLRAAIEELNAIGGGDIDFNIPVTDPGHVYYRDNGTAGFAAPVVTVAADDSSIVDFDADYPLTPFSWWQIAPATELPALTGTISIDGSTQPGHQANTVAGTGALDAILRVEIDNPATALAHGLQLSGSGSEVRGLVIDEGDYAITVDTNGAALIAGNWLGADVTGDGAGSTTDSGIELAAGADGNTVGGPTPADRNVIAHTSSHGLYLASDGNTITNNYVGFGLLGTTATGASAQDTGIWLLGSNNQIGDVGVGNVIGRNIDSGIWTPDGTGNRIQGNTFIANQDTAITFTGTSGQNLVGGDGIGEGNLITGTVAAPAIGVSVDSTSTDNAIIGNSITANDGLAIDLGAAYGDGVSPNDGGDLDGGANDGLNFPVLVAPEEGATSVDLTLDVPAGDYRIEVFANPTEGADPSGHGEGQNLVATQTVTHAGSGSEPFTVIIPVVFTGDVLTATATEDLGGGSYASTSEFSAAVTVVAGTDPVLDASVRRSDLDAAGGLDPAAAGTTGVLSPAMAFDGADDVLLGPALNVTDQALSVSAWVRADAFTGTDYIVSKQTAGSAPIYELGVNGGTGQAVATLRIGGSPVVVQGGAVTPGTWHHLAVTWDGANVDLYVDGAPVAATTATGSLAGDASTDVAIGNRTAATTGFDGLIEHVEITHDPLTAADAAVRHANSVAGSLTVTVGQQQTGAPGPWTVTTNQSRSGTYALAAPATANSGASAWAVATGIDEPGVVFESWWWIDSTTGVDLASGTRTGASPTDQFGAAFTSGSDWALRRRFGATTDIDGTGTLAPPTGTWVKVEQWTDQNGNSRLAVDGTEVVPWVGQTAPPAGGSVGFRVGELPGGQVWYIDDPRARKLISPEPVTTLGPLDRD